MKNLNKTLLILLCAGSIGLAGCGNSAGVSKDSSAAKDSTTIVDAPGASESSILMADASVSYLGPAGTYTEEAAMFFFPEAKTMMPKGTVDEGL